MPQIFKVAIALPDPINKVPNQLEAQEEDSVGKREQVLSIWSVYMHLSKNIDLF